MRGTPVLVVLAGIGGALLPSRAIGGPVTQPPLIIRIYDSVGLASDRLATARHAVSAVLKPATRDRSRATIGSDTHPSTYSTMPIVSRPCSQIGSRRWPAGPNPIQEPCSVT